MGVESFHNKFNLIINLNAKFVKSFYPKLAGATSGFIRVVRHISYFVI